jgi:hypothetical protein
MRSRSRRAAAAGQPLEKRSFVLLAAGVRFHPDTPKRGRYTPPPRLWTRLPVSSHSPSRFARNPDRAPGGKEPMANPTEPDPSTCEVPRPPHRRGAHVRSGLGTIVGASFLGMGIACLETPTFEDLK